MKSNHSGHKESKAELVIVLAILFALLAFIGFMIVRIARLNSSPREMIRTALATPEPTPEPTPFSMPIVTPELTPEPTPEPTPDPARFIKIANSELIEITKHPGGETVQYGYGAMFVAHADGAESREWRFVSPEYDREIVWNADEIQTEFPGMTCEDGDTDTILLYSVPKELDGWYVVCLFTDKDGGMVASEGAEIHVN